MFLWWTIDLIFGEWWIYLKFYKWAFLGGGGVFLGGGGLWPPTWALKPPLKTPLKTPISGRLLKSAPKNAPVSTFKWPQNDPF